MTHPHDTIGAVLSRCMTARTVSHILLSAVGIVGLIAVGIAETVEARKRRATP